MSKQHNETGLEIAVIGMAGRFPGAGDISQFWENLKHGVESLCFFSDKEFEEEGIDVGLLEESGYVKSGGGILEDKEYFDASFFGYSAMEAELMDPQVRVFHECAWHALENAAYDPYSYNGLIGLYAGASFNFYWEALTWLYGKMEILGDFAASLLIDRDYLCTRVSYNFDLKGPGVIVKTACSTSLTAVHIACQGILNGECDMALAGGVTITRLSAGGYRYQEGMVLSPDGHCRAFDAKAQGTAGGDGVGIVVLKRLEDAVRDGDYIHAVIKGTAINNDGARKAGYTAPSVMGQAEVISEALHVAEVDPESITYVEAHGTGTTVGDPIEIEALKMAFNTDKKGFCKIGSVKTNVGHLDSAAGVTGLIKTILALKHKLIPPSLHFETPNPKIDFENSPFYVNNRLSEWQRDGHPLRAGVSSFAIGGTNAHAVLEEAPEQETAPARRNWKLLLLSAKTPAALEQAAENLAEFLKHHPETNLADAAYTLQVGRAVFPHRRMVVGPDVDSAVEALSSDEPGKHPTFHLEEEKTSAVFMFAGLGAQYVNMGLGLYETEPVFREEMDRCFEIVRSLLDYDIKEVLYPASRDHRSNIDINQFEVAQVVVFILEYALAKLLMNWGVKPHAMIGYSFGEYTAACLSGVFSPEDALKLVVLRGKLIGRGTGGAMLSVPMTAEELIPLIPGELSLAIDNGPSCIVSGPGTAVDAFEKQLKEKKYLSMRVPNSHALHSKMMEPILKEFESFFGGIKLNRPQIPYISNVTGTWITVQEAVDPAYWAGHLRRTVRFADGINLLKKESNPIFIEIGPGRDLSTLLVRHRDAGSRQQAFNLVRQEQQDIPDDRYLVSRIGYLWLHGIKIDWKQFYAGERRQRIPLTTYPFERRRYWIEGNPFQTIGNTSYAAPSLSQPEEEQSPLFYLPSWRPTVLRPLPDGLQEGKDTRAKSCWLMFIDESNFTFQLVKRLEEEEIEVFRVKPGTRFKQLDNFTYSINPQNREDYAALLADIQSQDRLPVTIVHCWGISKNNHGDRELTIDQAEKAQLMGLYSLDHLARAIGEQEPGDGKQFQIKVITDNMQKLPGDEGFFPEKAPVLAAVKVIPREYSNIICGSIDISPPPAETRQEARLIELLLTELKQDISRPAIAYRGQESLEQYFAPVQLADTGKVPSRLKEKGVYMVSGGLTGSGFEIAQYLAVTLKPKLVIVENPGAPGSSYPGQGDRPALTGELLTETRIPMDMNEEVDFITQIEERIEKERGLKSAEDFEGLEEKLNDLCSACILDYFKQNDVDADVGSLFTLGDLKKKLRLQEKFNKFLGFFLSVLEEDQLITFQNDEITFLKRTAQLKGAVALKEEIEAGYPEFKGSLKLLDYCRRNYTGALSGEVEAISILYPGGRSVEVMEEYQDEVECSKERLYIHLFKEFISKLLKKKSKDKKLRILEIGAGKGLLTYVIAPGLNDQDVEYHFTDIGNFFVVNAKKETEERGFDFMKFGVLDISKDPGEQGYENHSFDLIVGLNVVNAARSIEEALGNLKPLLAPGGLMCLIEGTNAKRWLSMVVGLAEGWWYFEDSHLRPDCALLNLDTWQEVFEKQGFQDVFTFPMDKHKRAVTNCGIIFGRQESEIYVERREVKEKKQNLKQLEKTGAEVRVIEADVTDPEQMQQAVARVREQWGQVCGFVHCIEPGENGGKSLEKTLSPTIKGILTLDEVFKNIPLDFFVICSSLHSLTAPVTSNGTMGNSAVDIFINSFSHYKSSMAGVCTVTINWDANAGINIGKVFESVLDPSFAFSQLVVSAEAPTCWLTGPPTGEPGNILGTGRRGESSGAKHQRPELSSRYAAPRDETEQVIAEIWQEFFGIDQVGIYDDFLELGADSLVFVTIAARIHKALDVNIPIPVFFEKLNISGVAQYIKEAKKEVYAPIEPLEKREYYVASSVQRRLYFLQQMDKQSLGYNIPRAQILEGTLDKERIEIAFRRLIERHESLRTSFTIVGELPVQRVHETFDFAVEHYDLPGNDGSIDTIISQFVRPFDLSRAPLFRVGLIKESEERHVFMVDIHHVIADGISVGFLLVRDFMYFYSKQKLPGLTVHYKDYDRWLSREDMKETIKGQKAFWMKEFEGEVPVLELPTDFIRPEMHSFDGKSHMFEMGKEEADALKNFALKEGTSFFFLLLSTYYVILSKLSSQEDIVIGTPVSGRRHTDMENVVGMFINTVALRNFPKADKTFIEFLNEVKERSLTSFSNQDFQYEDLVQEVDVDRDTSRNPLFDVMFILENFEFADLTIPGLDLKPYWYDPGTSIFDQLLVIIEWGDVLMCRVEFSTKLFLEDTMKRFVEYYKRLLFFFIENPAVKLSDVEIVSEEEKTQLLFDFNAVQSDYPKEKTLHQLFEEQVEQTPDNISVIFNEHHYSYKILNRRSNQLACQLRQKGASADMMIGIMVKRSPEMLIGIMAILKTGGAYLPIDPDYPQERKSYILKDSNVKLLLFMKECESSLGEISQLIDLEDKTLYQGAGENPGIINKSDDPVYVIYTSGSAGKPKGVMVEHRNIVNYICWAIKIHKKSGNLNFPLFTSFSFDLTVTSIFAPLLSGSTVVVYEESEQVYVIGEVFDDNRLDIVKLTPSHLKLIQAPRSITIKHLILGGENLESQLALNTLEKFSGDVVIYNEYGPTETAVGCMIYQFSPGTGTRQFVPIGIPAGNVQIYVLDKNKRPLPPGVPGEIYISGDGVSRGYQNQPRLTAERFIDNPFLAGKRMYKTGDMAKFLPGNQIEFLGRIDHQVKVRGFRVELEEIQDKLMGYKKNEPIAFIDKDVHEIGLNNRHLCQRCLLPDNYPEIHLDDEGVCNTCREFERYEDEVNNYFKTGEDFDQLIAGAQKNRQGEYDCLLLFSGGKDSTYVLYQLIDMGLRVLTFTFDNGYISDAAFANIRRTTSDLNVENIVCTSENMNNVFVESLNTHHDVCHGCWNALNTYGIKLAHEHGINLVISGLSRGQIFEMRLEGLFREGIFDEEQVEQNLLLFRKSFHSRDNKFSRLLNVDLAEDAVDHIHFVDFFRYFSAPAVDIRRYLREKGWIQPEDTGFCSSNCLINDVGIYVHLEKEGYHFYAPQLSWDCRLGCIPRKQGLKEVAFAGDGKYELTGRILEEIGYYNPPIQDAVVLDRDGDNGDRKLIAYLVSHEQLVVPELRDYLARKLPDYMIPSNFVQVEKIPLTPNGKVDKKSLENEGTQVGTGVEFEAPKSDIEEKMVDIWKEILHVDKLGIRDNFFDLGGNSMDIMRLNSRLIKMFEKDIPVAMHFRYTTIKSFVQYLGQEGVDDSHISDRAEELKRGEQSKMSRLKARRGVLR